MGTSVTDGNLVSDFPAPAFTIRLFCDACGHQADLDTTKVPKGHHRPTADKAPTLHLLRQQGILDPYHL